MKPVKQTKRGGPDVPPGERGDCFDACLASVLEVPITHTHVPHTESWWDDAVDVVAKHGHRLLMVYSDTEGVPKWTVSALASWLGEVYWLASVPSMTLGSYPDGRPIRHVIVMRGAELVHDPTLGIPRPLGPMADDVPIFDAMLLVPLAGSRP